MALSENALMGLHTISAHPKPFTPKSLRSHRQVKGYKKYLHEGITEDPIPNREGMQVIIDGIAAEIIAKRRRERLMPTLQAKQTDQSDQEHGETE